uniref:AlNc14C446G11699 protein n=1 Tax=Albugo laibachii Nc14 TaxID=890382 RepID=F0WZV8_9STRA|nr:AlNc14C446G11699 [Albugo laibachii Nc14]|eukprot:CCA27037.1 AlNc14C446G11699 [Albugo laibachii Nc14]
MSNDSISSDSSSFLSSSDESPKVKAVVRKKACKTVRSNQSKQSKVVAQSEADMSDEMMAMKQVFLRISNKKAKQKEEKLNECKKECLETFQTEVNQMFKKALRSRDKALGIALNKISDLKNGVKSSNENLRTQHDEYTEAYGAECGKLNAHIVDMKNLLKLAKNKYNELIYVVEEEYGKLEQEISTSIDQLQTNLLDMSCDKSYLKEFQSQMKRIQSDVEVA